MYFIRLDSKGRLVLPLEIREAIGIETNGNLLVKVIATSGKSNVVRVELSKASDTQLAEGISYSKNGKYVMKEGLK